MKTPHNEEYKCYLPQDKMDADDEPVDIGQYAEDLLEPFMKVGANNKPNCTPGSQTRNLLELRAVSWEVCASVS